jgi:hypothetical protein
MVVQDVGKTARSLVCQQMVLVLLWLFCGIWLWPVGSLAGNFYAGITPATVPWTNGIVPYEFTNALTPAMQQTYLDGLREWELAANVKFIPHTTESRWILFTYNTNYLDNVAPGYNPQLVTVSSLSRAQVCHEMGHSFGFTHENIRSDQANYLAVISNNVTSGNLQFFQIDPTSVTNGNYDFESVMHLGWDFASTQPGALATQQPKPPYFPRYQFRMGNLCLSPGDRAALKYLYGPPAVPLTNVVTTTTDSGPGSLRAALYYVTDNPAASVRFNIPASDSGYSNGVFNIHLTGHLPPLVTNGMVIDGSTQPGFAGKPLIFVDGSQIIPETFTSNSGLLIYSSSNQIKNISFSGFNWNGLTLEFADATNNTIAGCWLGLDATGTNAAPNAYQGIYLESGASENIIGGTNALSRNVISGNAQYGIWMSDANTTGNTILGNYIGTDASGSSAVANALGGIGLFYNSAGQVIGGTNTAARNVISGNGSAGIWLSGPGVSNNLVQGNFIGINAAGTAAIPNTFVGIYVINGASSNVILDNVISGNYSEGLRLADAGTTANLIQGNYIGTDVTGVNPLPNNFAGLTIFSGAASNTIGGTFPAARNIISGNYYGFVAGNSGTSGNVMQGNYIGLGPDGFTAVPNFYGVLFSDGATNNFLGGTTAAARNVISGNNGSGVFLTDAGTSENFIQGNYIGPDATGASATPNGYEGIYIVAGASGNFIGGAAAGAGNVISGNTLRGIYISGTNTSGNLIQGNFIGTKADGTNALGNHWDGVVFFDGASSNIVGLTTGGVGAGNTIAFNGFTGIYVGSDNSDASLGNTIRGNNVYSNGYIGINLAGGTEDFYGVTANDPGDADTGPNNLQNYPVITSAAATGTSTIISGTLNSTASRTFLIDVYRNASADPSGYGQGQVYVGSATVTNDGGGNSVFVVTANGNFAGQFFTGTATDQTTGDTSEFNLAVAATNNLAPSASITGPYFFRPDGFIFTLTLATNFNYRIQAATNLAQNPIQWMDLASLTATNISLTFTDTAAANYHLRFYRVVSP